MVRPRKLRPTTHSPWHVDSLMGALVKQGIARDSSVGDRNFYYKLYLCDEDTYFFLISRTHNAELWAKSVTCSEDEAMECVSSMTDHRKCINILLNNDQYDVYKKTYPKKGCVVPKTVPLEFEYPNDDMSEKEFLAMIYAPTHQVPTQPSN